jgi:hypothetical protein
MYTKEQIWKSMKKELDIIKHLAEKIPAGAEHHKPTEKQRTTLELLQYLATSGVGTLDAIYENSMDGFGKYADRRAAVTVESFADAVDLEEKEMAGIYAKFDDTNLEEEISIFGMTQSRALFILDLLKTMTGYKMQLFLYIKASGVHNIGTSNVWGGIDTPPKE